MNGIRKGLLITGIMAVLGLSLTGCFRSTTEVTPTPSSVPLVTNMPAGTGALPGATLMPGSTLMPGAATSSQQFDWAAQAAAVENRINMFSEIQESSIVTSGNTALVGVVFASQYKGEMTQRIRDMIAGEVMAADPGIQVVAVTSEAQDVATIKQLAQRQRSGAGGDQIKADVEKIVRNATTLR